MITGKIIGIKSQKDNDWGRYSVSTSEMKEHMCVGVIPGASLGMEVTLEGKEEDTKWGRQFKISSVLRSEADKFAGIRRFLTDGYIRGVGPSKAEILIQVFGKDTLKMLASKDGKERMLSIPGFTSTKVDEISASYEKNSKYSDIVLFLNGEVTKTQAQKIYDLYGDKAVNELKKNPYILSEKLQGVGFKKADRIALATGIKRDSTKRILAAIEYALSNAATDGHCYLTEPELESAVIEEIAEFPTASERKITRQVVENAIKDWTKGKERLINEYKASAETVASVAQAVETRSLIKAAIAPSLKEGIDMGHIINDNGHYYLPQLYEAEKRSAERLQELLKKPPVRTVSDDIIGKAIKALEEEKNRELGEGAFKVTDEQEKAIRLALSNRVSIISGGPGRGKTAISQVVAEAFLMAGDKDKDNVIMLAPTGRAAQRITESTGYSAMTVHRAVYAANIAIGEVNKGADRADYKNTLPPVGKLVLCDESSMLDIFLFRSVLEYAKESNIIFVGDVDQIASVGPGKCLSDMINSTVIPSIILKEGHRNSGTIAENAVKINSGSKIQSYRYDYSFKYFPFFTDSENARPGDVLTTLSDMANAVIRDYRLKVQEYGIRDVMLCCAMKDRGDLSVNNLNSKIQQLMTIGREEAVFKNGQKYRVGDRVMHTKNCSSFDQRIDKDGKRIKGIFNGERGVVQRVRTKRDESGQTLYNILVQFDDGSIASYSDDTIGILTLAYATTLHKCQGSEAKCMMMVYTYGDFILLNKSLFYTGETRARKEFRFYGEEKIRYGKKTSAFDIAVRSNKDTKRNTGLKDMLVNFVA